MKVTALGTSTVAAVTIGAVAFSMSFVALSELAAQNGQASMSWGLPVIVDGLMVGATAATVGLSNRASRAYAYLTLALGTALSIAGNVAHSVQTGQGPIGVAIAAIIPVILFITTHLTVLLARERMAKTVETVGQKPAEQSIEDLLDEVDKATDKDLVSVG